MLPNQSPFAHHLPKLALLAMVCFAAYGLFADELSPAARSHLVLALGVLPLILANILSFSATLLRTSQPSGRAWFWPVLSFIAGLILVAALSYDPRYALISVVLGFIAVGGVWQWIQRAKKKSLGSPHPGVRWYEGALLSLAFGLIAMGVGLVWDDLWIPLRSIHLHLNLMGFVALTAVGTLQVLIPTVANFHDEKVMERLARHWPYALGGTFASALGAAGWHIFNILGLILWLVPLLPWTGKLWQVRIKLLERGGAMWPLMAALFGFWVMMFSGLLIVAGWMSPENTLPLFFIGFVFPLVMGALTHLLPMWWWPGLETPLRSQARDAMEVGSPGRALLLVICGIGAIWAMPWAAPLATAAILQFLIQVVIIRKKTPVM
uniref:Uncharacterized protein n=1 Tax=Magnetococcus massalia (strain MO-1) TaxID=451514 RepID=A0A1S7LNI6_MAGMO|nr:Conserved membrane protein of unknown function [Candidatus Magnetococcus massalia]